MILHPFQHYLSHQNDGKLIMKGCVQWNCLSLRRFHLEQGLNSVVLCCSTSTGTAEVKSGQSVNLSTLFLGRFRVIRALNLRNLGPKFGPIPKAKKYVFFPILDEKFPIWQSVFGSGKYQV